MRQLPDVHWVSKEGVSLVYGAHPGSRNLATLRESKRFRRKVKIYEMCRQRPPCSSIALCPRCDLKPFFLIARPKLGRDFLKLASIASSGRIAGGRRAASRTTCQRRPPRPTTRPSCSRVPAAFERARFSSSSGRMRLLAVRNSCEQDDAGCSALSSGHPQISLWTAAALEQILWQPKLLPTAQCARRRWTLPLSCIYSWMLTDDSPTRAALGQFRAVQSIDTVGYFFYSILRVFACIRMHSHVAISFVGRQECRMLSADCNRRIDDLRGIKTSGNFAGHSCCCTTTCPICHGLCARVRSAQQQLSRRISRHICNYGISPPSPHNMTVAI